MVFDRLHKPSAAQELSAGHVSFVVEQTWSGQEKYPALSRVVHVTELNCLRHVIWQMLEHGYAHQIQSLMVTELFAMLLGVRPKEVHE